MQARRIAGIVVILLAITAPIHAAEVWFGASGRDPGIGRMTPEGTLLGRIASSQYVKSMVLVGDEVWCAWDDSNAPRIGRFKLDGTPLSEITGLSWLPTSMTVVGDEVWYGSKDLIGIGRLSLEGSKLGYLSTTPNDAQFLCSVPQNSQVWFGASGRDPGIGRMTSEGTLLGRIASSQYVKSMVLVGDEVWCAWDDSNAPRIGRFKLDGTPLSEITGLSWLPTSMTVVGDEVWYGSKDLIGIGRLSLEGSKLGYLSTTPNDAQFLVVVPEPATLSLLALGGLAMRRRK